jgi:hypothetical protein
MTNTNRDDDLRDPRFDAVWRETSREEPPGALDAAIRADARRAVGAGPKRESSAVPEATSPERWWWPLAAAATIGAITIGLLQLAPPAREAANSTSAIVSDIPAGSTANGDAAQRERVPAAGPPPRAPQPFPAEPGKPEAGAPPAPAAPTPLPQREPAAQAAPQTPRPAMPTVAERHPEAKRLPTRAEREAARHSGALAEQRGDPVVEAKAQERAPLAVADWIALIRKLVTDGRDDEVALELEAFRFAHPDADTLLPPDLRDWRPASR